MGKIFHANWDDPTLSAVQRTMKSSSLTNMVEMDMRTYDYVCPLIGIQRFMFVISDRNGLDEPSKALDLNILILARTTTAGVNNDHYRNRRDELDIYQRYLIIDIVVLLQHECAGRLRYSACEECGSR
jgi:hypothetical protein